MKMYPDYSRNILTRLSVRRTDMIADKLVTIEKENTFEYGWALFAPWHDFPRRNNNYQAVGVSEVVKQITFSKAVTLLLSEPCLPRKVIDELKWVEPYAKITLLARSNDVAAFYKDLQVSSVRIDPSLSLNYIGIDGKDKKASYFISEGFHPANDSVERLFVSAQKHEIDCSPFADADKVIVLGDDAQYLSILFEYCKRNRIPVFLAKGIADFNKSDYDAYRNSMINLLVAEHIGEGICVQKSGKLFHASCVKGQFTFSETADFDRWLSGNIYCNLKKNAVLQINELPQNAYILHAERIRPLLLKDWHIVKKTVQTEMMEDFVFERFDRSETEKHNQFSNIAKCVEYRFVLVPPLLPSENAVSSLYQGAQDLLSQWKACYAIPVQTIQDALIEFEGSQNFLSVLAHINDSDVSIRNIIGEYHYQNYRAVFQSHKNRLAQDREALIESCSALNVPIVAEIHHAQTSGIDDEIRGYEKTIREKETCIEQNIDVLQSKRRIEILKHKIEELQKVKERLTAVQTSNSVNSQRMFVDYCEQLLNGITTATGEDSVSSIVNGREQSKQERLNVFLQVWLKPVKDLLDKLIDLLVKMETIDVPENYIVYDHAGKRYIVIESEDEYLQTLQRQKRYHLLCVVRR